MMKSLSVALFAMLMAFSVHAAIDTYNFKSVEEEQQFREFTGSFAARNAKITVSPILMRPLRPICATKYLS